MILNNLNKVFSNTQNSYKYYWWLSIIEISLKEDNQEISFEEIVLKTISKLWYPVNYFKLSFGKIDKCSKHIKQIKQKYLLDDNISEQSLYDFLLNHKDSELLISITKELTRYVPYRFIRPWFNEATRGLKDNLVNSKILDLQNNTAPYKIDIASKKIILDTNWCNWIKNNFKLLESYTYFELIKYLEKENPNVTSLSKKIKKPKSRNLSLSTKHWRNYIIKTPNEIDVFEKKPLGLIKDLSIDHFLPWSFLTHDLIWNLHPINKNVNSSKNNLIPKKDYFPQFYSLQYNFCNYLLNENKTKPLENYYTLFNCSNEDLKKIPKEQFIKRMERFYLPQYEIAKNMGFQCDWSLK